MSILPGDPARQTIHQPENSGAQQNRLRLAQIHMTWFPGFDWPQRRLREGTPCTHAYAYKRHSHTHSQRTTCCPPIELTPVGRSSPSCWFSSLPSSPPKCRISSPVIPRTCRPMATRPRSCSPRRALRTMTSLFCPVTSASPLTKW